MFVKRMLLIVLIASVFPVYGQFGDSFPVLTFDVDTADFGTVNEGDTVRFDFWFTNTGTRDLIIKQAWPACGCTTPVFTNSPVKPGERGVIHVEFHSKGWGGQTVVKEIIVLLVNGPENTAKFKAKVVNQAFLNELEEYKSKRKDQGHKRKKKNKQKGE